MKKVKFLREFGGRETGEIHYPEGHEMDMNLMLATDLESRGIVKILGKPAPTKGKAPAKGKASAKGKSAKK